MSDALKQAKQSLARAFGDYGQEINSQRAQAAALIAQVEATCAQNAILERIAVVLEGVYDPKAEMLRVEAWNYDTRRELG